MKKVIAILGLFLMLPLCLCQASEVQVDRGSKKLIYWGWQSPTPQFLHDNIVEIEEMPFDGVTIDIPVTSPGDETLGKSMFYPRAWIRKWMVEKELKLLKETQFKKLTDNFIVLRLSASPETIDWFDDFESVINNFRTAAWLAKDAGLKGFLIDLEQYGHSRIFTYAYRKYPEKSWAEYEAQVFQKSREIMQAINSEYPEITILFQRAYTFTRFPRADIDAGRAKNRAGLASPTVKNNLGVPLLDGMVDAASPGTRFIEIMEQYSSTTEEDFKRDLRDMKSALDNLSAIPEKAREKFSFGFGIWPKMQPERRWHPTAGAWGKSVSAALRNTDEYVWIYTEREHFWRVPDKPKSIKLPRSYIEAQRKARP